MNGGRVLFDASAYMLFEASGDSEVECFDGTIGAAFEVESDAGAEDDAQSCSYGQVNEIDAGGDDFHGEDFVRDGEYFSGEEDREEEDCRDSDEEDGVVDQCYGGCMVAPPESSVADAEAEGKRKGKLKKSKACEDSKVKLLNERERDRQFWENCLAS